MIGSERLKKIKEFHNNLKLPAKASLWFVICNCMQKATQIITTPIYTRILSTEQYGEYTVFLSWVELVAILATLDIFYSGYNVGMEKFKSDRENYTSSMHGLCFLLTSFWTILFFIFSKKISSIMGISELHVKILMIYMYIYPIFLFWSGQKKYDYNYKPLLVVTVLLSVFSIAIGTVFAYFSIDKSTAVILSKILVEGIISIPLLISSVKSIKSLFNQFYWEYALRFNIPLIPHYLSTMVLNHSDRIMILNMCSAADAAIYSVAYSIAMLMTIVQNAINSAITPWLYGKLASNDFDKVKEILSFVIIGMASLNLLLIFIAPEIVKILSSSSYYEAIWVIPPVSFGIFLTLIYGFFVNIELYFDNNRLAAFGSICAALVNLFLNFIFINIYGYIAAGYTTLVSYLLLVILHFYGMKNICLKKNLDITMIFDIKLIVIISLIFAIISIIVMHLYKVFLVRYIMIVLLLIIFFYKRQNIINLLKEIKS